MNLIRLTCVKNMTIRFKRSLISLKDAQICPHTELIFSDLETDSHRYTPIDPLRLHNLVNYASKDMLLK